MRPSPIDWPADTAMTDWKDYLVTLAELAKFAVIEAEAADKPRWQIKALKEKATIAARAAGLGKIGFR